jgi:hypothetical protein
MKKRILSVLLCLVLVIANSSLALALDTGYQANSFCDMPDDWSKVALTNAVDNGLLKGYEKAGKTYIYAKNPVTRAEMATVINRAFGSSVKADISEARDVASTKWYANEMAKAVMMGAFSKDTKMRPNDNITRQEAFVVLARVFKIESGDQKYTALDSFSDKGQISEWAKGEICGMVEAGYVNGSGGKLLPLATISRAEFAVVMNNLVKQYISQPGTRTEVPASGNVLIRAEGVTLKNLTIKGDLIIGDGVGEGDVTLDGVEVEGKVIVRGGGVNSLYFAGNSRAGVLVLGKPFGDVRLVIASSAILGNILVGAESQGVIVEGIFLSLNVIASNITLKIDPSMESKTIVTGNNSSVSFNDTTPISQGHGDGISSIEVWWASNGALEKPAISVAGLSTSEEVTDLLDIEVSVYSTDGNLGTATIEWLPIYNYDGTSPGAYTACGSLTLPWRWRGPAESILATVNVCYADESDFGISAVEEGCQIISYTGTSSALAIPEHISGSAVISIGAEAFHNKQFTNIRLPNGLTSIGSKAFLDCSQLQNITIPSSVTTIGQEAFKGCSALTSIIIQGEGQKTVNNLCFVGCINVTSVRVSSASITFGDELFASFDDSFRDAYTSGAASPPAIGVPGTYTKDISTEVWSRQ